jgi:hypothetical protein
MTQQNKLSKMLYNSSLLLAKNKTTKILALLKMKINHFSIEFSKRK